MFFLCELPALMCVVAGGTKQINIGAIASLFCTQDSYNKQARAACDKQKIRSSPF